MSNNRLRGALPSNWSSLTALQYLFVLFSVCVLLALLLKFIRLDTWGGINLLEFFLLLGLFFPICLNCKLLLPFRDCILTCIQRQLNFNQLSGSLPREWANFASLQSLYFPLFLSREAILTSLFFLKGIWATMI